VLVGYTYTGLGANRTPTIQDGGNNLSVIAGADIGFYSLGHYEFAGEVRGSLPVDQGKIVGQRALQGGLRVSYESSHTLRPYVDALFGRGQMDYQQGGYPVGNLLYKQTAGNVYGGGGGVEWDLMRQISLKADAQVNQWSTPVTERGYVRSVQFSVGAAYRFGAGAGPR
jgi:hypothetical protein